MNHSLTNLTRASWGPSRCQFCSPWSPSGGLVRDRCSPVCIWILTVGWEMSDCFQTFTLGPCPLPNASKPCRGPQTALSKQLCQNILCWWRLQSVTSSFLINWWGTARAHSAVAAEFISGVPWDGMGWAWDEVSKGNVVTDWWASLRHTGNGK